MPISVVTSETVNFVISTIIILAFVIFGGIPITASILFYPLILLVQYLLTLGISLIVSSITVYLRDLQHLIGIALQLLFYAAPVVYNFSIIGDERIQKILNLNPMTHIINAYRDIFYNHTTPDVKVLLILAGIMLIVCVIGYTIFHKLQKGFAEEL